MRSAIKAFNNTSLSVDDLSEKFGGLDNSVVEYLNNTERGRASMDGLSKSIDNSTTSMISATAKAKILAVALNALTGLAISLAIKGFTWAVDELVVTLDEQKEKLDEAVIAYKESKSELEKINDELKTTGERIDELNGKENLTFTEQDELEKLIKTNDELERKIYLLEQANKEAEKEVATKAQNTYDKYTNNRTLGAVEQIEFYTDSSLLEGVNWDNFKSDLSWLVAQYKNQEEILVNAQADGLTIIEEQTKSNLELLEGYMSEVSLDYQDLYDKISGISDYAMTDDLKVAKQDLDDILDIVAEILDYGGQRSETSFDDIWNSEDFSLYKTELEALAKEGKLDASVLESNENYKKLLQDTGATAEDTAQHINALVDEMKKMGTQNSDTVIISDIFSLEGADDTLTTLGKISESIDTIQNAYKTLNDAIDEYNETGSFSIDTLQSVIALGDNWLDYLVDEEGKLKLDKEALQQLTASRLEDMKMQAINNIIDNVSKIQTDADATLYLASTNYALAESYEDVAENAIEAAKAQMELAVVAGTLSQENYEASASKMDADIEKVYKLFDNTDFISDISLGGGSGSKTKSDFEETIDFFERRIDILNDTISRLKSNLENVTGSFAKNNLIDAQSSIYQEELRNYTDALAMYQKKANEVLATLPDDIAEKVKNGAIDLTTFVGMSSEAVVDAIGDYQNWADRVSEVKLQLIELQKTLSDLELEKFNNVVSDFSSQFDLRDNVVTNIDKHIALLEEQGQLIGASFYDAQIQQSQKQLALLEQEKIQLVEQMNSAIASGNVKTGSEAWLEMVSVLSDVEGQIIDCKKSIEEFSNEILELNWKSFERVQDTFSDLNTELENFVGLLDDIDVADDKGNWSTEAKTKLGLLSQQYELAVYQVGEYRSAIEELKKQYTNGDYSAIEFSEKLAELSDGMWDATNSAEDLRDAIVDLNEQRVEVQIEGIEKEISAYEELVDEQIKLIEETDNLIKKRDDLAEKSKSVTDLERQIASMMHDDSQATVAKRLKLEEELAEARKDLADTEREYSVDSQKTALEKQLEEYTNERNAEIEALEKSLENKEQLIADSFNVVKQNANLIGQQIAQIATEHGVIVSDSLISSWAQGENAIASYGTVLSDKSSVFIGNIMDVESKVWDLQSQANNTSTSLAGMFSTQADNLVSELSQSYYAEGNVLNMTNALHDSLVNTLESGYDVSKITSALKSIEDSAKAAADEIRELKEEENSANSRPVYAVVDRATGKTVATYNDIDEADAFIKSAKFADRNLLKPRELYVERYASGTRSSKGNIIITDEEGQELKLPKLSSGNYTIANEGTQILTKVQTDNIFDWSKINPDELIPQFTKNVFNDIPKVVTRNVNHSQPVTIENKVIFTGAVNDANNFAKQIAQITDKQITKSWKEFTSELHR